MRSFLRLLFLCFTFVVAPTSIYAQNGSLAGTGVVLLHGKGGRPGGPLSGIASALEAQGAIVLMPTMAWSGSRGVVTAYDLTYDESIAAIQSSIAQLRAKGARRIVVAGQSLGANAAIAFVARQPNGIAGLIALAPGHNPDRLARRPEFAAAVKEARALVARGQGATRGAYPDSNQSLSGQVSGSAAAWLSYFDPDGPAVMPRNASRLSLPFLYVIGTGDPLHADGRAYIFARAKPNAKSRYVEVDAGHFDTPDAARAVVIDWLRAL